MMFVPPKSLLDPVLAIGIVGGAAWLLLKYAQRRRTGTVEYRYRVIENRWGYRIVTDDGCKPSEGDILLIRAALDGRPRDTMSSEVDLFLASGGFNRFYNEEDWR